MVLWRCRRCEKNIDERMRTRFCRLETRIRIRRIEVVSRTYIRELSESDPD